MYSKHRQKKIQFILTECGHSLIFLFLLLLNNVLEIESGDSTEQAGKPHGQTVVPRWLSQSRTRRDVGIQQQVQYPDTGAIAVTAEGRELVLHVERNHELLGPDFTETHYSEAGDQVTISANQTDHCFYHGYVRGHPGSWVVLSTCSGVRNFPCETQPE